MIVDPEALPKPRSLYGPERFQAELAALLARAVAAAERDWARGATFEGMLGIIRTIHERNPNCFGFRNYTQLPLAFIFLAARVGDKALAERELEEHLRGGWLAEREAEKLKRLLAECKPA